MLDRLNRGVSFESLARAESIDPSAGQGGLVGPVALSDLRPELRNVLQDARARCEQSHRPDPVGLRHRAAVAADRSGSTDRRRRAGRAGGSRERGNRRSVSTASSRRTRRSSSFRRARTGIRIRGEICRIRQQSLSEIVTAITRFADETQGNDKVSAIDAIQAHVVLGQLHAYTGRMAEAIDQFGKGAPEGRERFSRCRAPDRGNARHFIPPQVRTRQRRFPLARGPMPVASKDDACCRDTRFAEGDRVLHGILERRPQDFEVKWLLNLAYMTVGGYPGRVPSAHLIPASTFESPETIGRFVDVAAAAGVDSFSSAGGVIVDDFDNDGSLEILTSNFDHWAPCSCSVAARTACSSTRPRQAGLSRSARRPQPVSGRLQQRSAAATCSYCVADGSGAAQSLLRNNCDGTFTDVTRRAVWPSRSPAADRRLGRHRQRRLG